MPSVRTAAQKKGLISVGPFEGEDKEVYRFKCAQSGFLCEKRVSFDHDFLRKHKLYATMSPYSFMDWNNAAAFINKMHQNNQIETSDFKLLWDYIMEVNGLDFKTDHISFPPADVKIYPDHVDGLSPSDYRKSYHPVLMAKCQSVEDVLGQIEEEERNKQPPTQEELERKERNLAALRQKNNLNMKVYIKALPQEREEEQRRIQEAEAEEKSILQAAPDAPLPGGKRKAGALKEIQKKKKAKISPDGWKKFLYSVGNVPSTANLLGLILGGPRGTLSYYISTEDGETALYLASASGSGAPVKWTLPTSL